MSVDDDDDDKDGRPTVIVVGAGMAGLSAAWHLQRAGVNVTVLERDTRVGGRVRTESVHGFEIEAGAGFLAGSYTHTMRLISELGLRPQLAPLSMSGAILRDGRLHPVWPRREMVRSPLLPLRSKLVLLGAGSLLLRHWRDLDLHAVERAARLDTASAADLGRRRLDDDIAAYILEPVLDGFLYTAPERTSQAMLLVLLKLGLRLGPLYTLAGGLGRLPQAVAATLQVSLGSPVGAVRVRASGGYDVVTVVDGKERRLRADGVICATTASAARRVVVDLSPPQRRFLDAVTYAPNATTALAIGHRLDRTPHAMLFPRRESRDLALASVQSASGPHRLPAGRDLLMLYPSGAASRELLRLDDATIRDRLLTDLHRAGLPCRLDQQVLFHLVHRWHEAVPEFGVGYVRALRRFTASQIGCGRVVLAGDYLAAPMVEGAVTSGLLAARRLLGRLGMVERRSRPPSGLLSS